MALPNSDNLKAKLPMEKENFDQDRRLENLEVLPTTSLQNCKKRTNPHT